MQVGQQEDKGVILKWTLADFENNLPYDEVWATFDL